MLPSWAQSVAGSTEFSPTHTSITGQFPPAVFLWIRQLFFRLVGIGSSIACLSGVLILTV